MKVSTIPAMLIMAVIVFAATAITNQLLDGEPKLVRSAVYGAVFSIMFVLWLKYASAKNSENEVE